jgi:hypothetical protein
MSLRVVPITLAQANDFVSRLHRHHPPAVGHRFSLGLMEGERWCGVVIVGHPVARMLEGERLVEVVRLCTDGTRNACSALYGAAARTAQAMGYFAILTYTLDEEGGASLRAAAWWGEPAPHLTKTWATPSDPRRMGGIAKPKWRWVRFLSEWPDWIPAGPEETTGPVQAILL